MALIRAIESFSKPASVANGSIAASCTAVFFLIALKGVFQRFLNANTEEKHWRRQLLATVGHAPSQKQKKRKQKRKDYGGKETKPQKGERE